MRKKLILITAALVILFMIVPSFPGVCASFADDTTYTVKIQPGKKGMLTTETEYSGYKYNETFSGNITQKDVNIKDESKYYVKGFRLSGHDNNEFVTSLAGFKVNKDLTYEVAYGVKGQMVTFTARYVDENGKSIAAEDTFYGKVGDKPTVLYKYIDRYMPASYALGKKLTEDPAENVFEFKYINIGKEKPAPVDPIAPLTYSAAAASGSSSNSSDASEDENMPVQYIDLDGEEQTVPQPRDEEPKSKVPYIIGSLIAAAVIALIIIIAILNRKIKRKYRNY